MTYRYTKLDEFTYEIQFPEGKRLYKKNVGRNCMVGEKSYGDAESLDIYYFNEVSQTMIDLELATSSINYEKYVVVNVKGAKDRFTEYAHRIVCWSWNGPFPNDYEVDHINGNKSDNSPSNLEAVPPIVNAFRALKNYGYGDEAWKKYSDILIGHLSKAKNPRELIKMMEDVIKYENKK
jgi:hypothetical protein